MLYTITIEIEAPSAENAHKIMNSAADEIYESVDPDQGEQILSWRVDPK